MSGFQYRTDRYARLTSRPAQQWAARCARATSTPPHPRRAHAPSHQRSLDCPELSFSRTPRSLCITVFNRDGERVSADSHGYRCPRPTGRCRSSERSSRTSLPPGRWPRAPHLRPCVALDRSLPFTLPVHHGLALTSQSRWMRAAPRASGSLPPRSAATSSKFRKVSSHEPLLPAKRHAHGGRRCNDSHRDEGYQSRRRAHDIVPPACG